MKTRLLYCLLPLLLATALAPLARGQTSAFTYQGELILNGSPASGSYDFKFRVYPSATGPGNIGPEFVTNGLPVANGLLTVPMDFGYLPWTTCQRRWLEIDVRQGAAAYVTLAPRTEVTPTPYAIYAQAACSVAPGQVVTSLNGLKDAVTLSAGANVTLTPSGNDIQISAAGPGTEIWSRNGTSAYYNAGNVGIGTSTPIRPLEVNGVLGVMDSNTRTFNAGVATEAGARLLNIGINDDLANRFGGSFDSSAQGGFLRVESRAGAPLFGFFGRSAEVNGAVSELGSITSEGTVRFEIGTGQRLSLGGSGSFEIDAPFIPAGRFVVADSGNVGIGIANPQARLTIENGGPKLIGTALSSTLVTSAGLMPSGVGDDAALANFGVIAGNNVSLGVRARRTALGDGWGSTAIGLTFDVDNTVQAGAGIWLAPSGNVGIGTASPGAKLQVSHLGGVGMFSGDLSPFGTAAFESNLSTSTTHAWFAENGNRVFSVGPGGAGFFAGNMSACSVTIRGGCDLAEPFQMSESEIPKGALVIIDEEHEGKLKLAGQEYDTRVAGIVSGANGVNTGISLHQEGVIEGGQDVALSGRVYALADASNGSIKPGDLLTSSCTTGHVMKVTDHARAQGAIVGKAMSALKEGKGMVLVLVSLQ